MLSPLPSGPSGLHDDLCSVYSGGLKQSSLSGTLPKALLLHIPVLNKVCLTLPGRLPVLVPTAPVSHAPAPFPACLLSCDQRPQLQAGQFVKFSPLKFPRRLPLPGAQQLHSYCVWWGGDLGTRPPLPLLPYHPDSRGRGGLGICPPASLLQVCFPGLSSLAILSPSALGLGVKWRLSMGFVRAVGECEVLRSAGC